MPGPQSPGCFGGARLGISSVGWRLYVLCARVLCLCSTHRCACVAVCMCTNAHVCTSARGHTQMCACVHRGICALCTRTQVHVCVPTSACVQMLHVCTRRQAGTRARAQRRAWARAHVCAAMSVQDGPRAGPMHAHRPCVWGARGPGACAGPWRARVPRVCRIQPGFSEWLEPAAFPAGVSVPSAFGAAAAQVGGAGPAAPRLLQFCRDAPPPRGSGNFLRAPGAGRGSAGGRRAVPPRPDRQGPPGCAASRSD